MGEFLFEAAADGGSGVGGLVVDEDDAEVGIVHGAEGAEGGVEEVAFVAAGDDDGDGGPGRRITSTITPPLLEDVIVGNEVVELVRGVGGAVGEAADAALGGGNQEPEPERGDEAY